MRKFVAVWDHFDPDVLYLLKGDAKEIIKKIGEYSDYCYREIESESKLLGIEWNDEECYSWYVPGESLDEAKGVAANDIYNQLKKIQQEQHEQPDYSHIYLECCLYCGGEFEREFNLETEQKVLEATKIYVDRFLTYIEDSYVDCDSNSAIAILDLDNETVEIGQEVIFTTLEQFIGEDEE